MVKVEFVEEICDWFGVKVEKKLSFWVRVREHGFCGQRRGTKTIKKAIRSTGRRWISCVLSATLEGAEDVVTEGFESCWIRLVVVCSIALVLAVAVGEVGRLVFVVVVPLFYFSAAGKADLCKVYSRGKHLQPQGPARLLVGAVRGQSSAVRAPQEEANFGARHRWQDRSRQARRW